MRVFWHLAHLYCLCLLPWAPRPAPLQHDAYVWQHAWGSDMRAAVRDRPALLQSLHVLIGTLRLPDRQFSAADVAVQSLAHIGPVIAVLRVEGTAPLDDRGRQQAVAAAKLWQHQGVQVSGLEVDYDCPTARLADYATWLATARQAAAPLPIAITALPTWVQSPALPKLLAQTSRVTLQLHAIRADKLFDAAEALAWCETWARATDQPFWIALPTYSVQLKSGATVAADPQQLQHFMAALARNRPPDLRGVVWFRLGYEGDPDAWSAQTLAAVVTGSPLAPKITVELHAVQADLWDIVVHNDGNVAGPVPAHVPLSGRVAVREGVRGCRAADSGLTCAEGQEVPPGSALVVGFARGEDVRYVGP